MNFCTKLFLKRCRIIIQLLVSLLFFVSGKQAFSQHQENASSIFVTSYGIEEGLRQSMVRQVCQDSRGLIWMVTGDGLQCFDGKEFRLFRVPITDQESYSENIMREMVESKPGQFTISTSSSILNFNSTTGDFKVVFRKPGNHPRIFKLLYQQKPLAWISGKGLFQVDGIRLIPLRLKNSEPNNQPDDFYPSHAVESRFGTILLEHEKGYLEINMNTASADSGFAARWFPLEKGCQGLAKDKQGNVFLLSGGTIYSCQQNGLLRQYFHTGLSKLSYLSIDRNENFWMADKLNKKVYRLNNNCFQEITILAREGKYADTLNPVVLSIYEDKHENLWFGTDGEGVLLYSPGLTQFARAKTGFTRCIASMNNEIYAGTFKNGLWRLSADLSKAQRMAPLTFTDDLYFLDLSADRHGRIWAATDKGIFVADPQGKIIARFADKISTASFINNAKDTITLSTDKGLYYFFPGTTPSLSRSQPYPFIRGFLQVNDKQWIGTPFGLYLTDKGLGSTEMHVFSGSNKLSGKPVFDLSFIENCIWVATENGIERYSIQGQKMPAIKSMDELENEVVYSIHSDSLKRIWFSSNKGIGCISASGDRIIWFNQRNNLQSLEFNTNASLKTTDGMIYFGGIKGVNGINPQSFKPEKLTPEVQLISLYISDTAYSHGIAPAKHEVFISWKSPNIGGKVFTTNYRNNEMQLFSFFLEGYDLNWGHPASNPAFSYRNLPPGQYRLMVKCTDDQKNESDPKCLLSITIKPPIWKTWWFILLISLFTIAISAYIARKVQEFRYKNKLKELERLNAIDKERLRISKDLHDEVGASLTRISILSQLANNQNHPEEESKKLVSQINEIAGNVVDEMSEIIWAMNSKNDCLDSFASYLRHYVSGYLESAGIEGNFQFPAEIPPAPMSAEMRRNFFLTAKEAIHNIVKHASATRVEIILTYNQNLLSITIIDNGRGFNEQQISFKGNGLVNMNKRMYDLGGNFKMHSETGKGTHITISATLLPHHN